MAQKKMLAEKLSLCIFAAFVAVIPGQAEGSHTPARNVTSELLCPKNIWPCKSHNSSYANLYHVQARGANDTLHYLVSTLGSPSILVALTSPSAQLEKINFANFLSGNQSRVAKSIKFTEAPHYAFCLILSRLWEYSDLDDAADLEKASENNETSMATYPLDQLNWEDSSQLSNLTENRLLFQIEENPMLRLQDNGSFGFNFQPFGASDRSSDLPHLQHTSNSAQLDVVLDNLVVSFNKSRFAVEMLLVSVDNDTDPMGIKSHRSIDDEHTPGVFELIDWFTGKISQKTGAYVQWKPVCYKKDKRERAVATKVKAYDLQPGELVYNKSQHKVPVSAINLALAYFGENLYTGQLAMRAANVSFGLTNDKFYVDTNYTAWTFTVGYGTPPQDEVSALIILIISIGLGIPVVLMIFGGLCVCIKKQQQKRRARETEEVTSTYTRIQ